MLVMSKKKTEQSEEPAEEQPEEIRKYPRYPSRETYTSITIPKKMAEKLRPIAKKMDRSISYVVRKACEAFIQAHSGDQQQSKS